MRGRKVKKRGEYMVGRRVTVRWNKKEDWEKNGQKGRGRVRGIVTVSFGIIEERAKKGGE